MFINIGTITAATNEAQLAGVMAHEMSHVYMQHSAKQARKAETTGILTGLAGAVLGSTVGGTAGQLAETGIQVSAQGVMLKYSRSDESQADAVGAIILYKAGYNPQAMADFFKALESQGGKVPPQWLSDHPNPGNREQAIEKEIKNWPPGAYASNSSAFQKARQHAMGVKAYTGEEIAQGAKSGEWSAMNKKNGSTFSPTDSKAVGTTPLASSLSSSGNTSEVALQSLLPSQRILTADLGPVKIDYPENWQVIMPKQQGHFVTIAPQAGITGSGVGCGVLINGIVLRDGERLSIDETTRQLAEDMQRNNKLQLVSDLQPITVSGIEGRSASFQTTSPFHTANGQEQKELNWLVTVPLHNGSVVFVIFIAPESDFERFQSAYEAMLKSLRF